MAAGEGAAVEPLLSSARNPSPLTLEKRLGVSRGESDGEEEEEGGEGGADGGNGGLDRGGASPVARALNREGLRYKRKGLFCFAFFCCNNTILCYCALLYRAVLFS